MTGEDARERLSDARRTPEGPLGPCGWRPTVENILAELADAMKLEHKRRNGAINILVDKLQGHTKRIEALEHGMRNCADYISGSEGTNHD